MPQVAPINRKKEFKLDKTFITPFLVATKDVFNTMVHVAPAAQSPMLWAKTYPIGDVAAVIPMACEQVEGQLTVSFLADTLVFVASKMMMEEFTVLDDTVRDAAGEITNMITGSAKVALQESGYDFGMDRPSIYNNSDYDHLALVGEPRMLVPYQIADKLFYIDLGFVAT